jgi:hypothetical protein
MQIILDLSVLCASFVYFVVNFYRKVYKENAESDTEVLFIQLFDTTWCPN